MLKRVSNRTVLNALQKRFFAVSKRKVYNHDILLEDSITPYRKINDVSQIEDDPCAPDDVLYWAEEVSEINWERRKKQLREEINFVWSTFNHVDTPLSNLKHKTRVLIAVENQLGISIAGNALREMKSKEGIIDWCLKETQIREYMKSRKGRYREKPANLKLELPPNWSLNRFDPWRNKEKVVP